MNHLYITTLAFLCTALNLYSMERTSAPKLTALQQFSAARAQERANNQSPADAAAITRCYSEPIVLYNQDEITFEKQCKNKKKKELLKMFQEECDDFLCKAQSECAAAYRLQGKQQPIQLGNPLIEAHLKQKQSDKEQAIVELSHRFQSATDAKGRAQIKHEMTFLSIDFYEIGLAITLNALIRASIE